MPVELVKVRVEKGLSPFGGPVWKGASSSPHAGTRQPCRFYSSPDEGGGAATPISRLGHLSQNMGIEPAQFRCV